MTSNSEWSDVDRALRRYRKAQTITVWCSHCPAEFFGTGAGLRLWAHIDGAHMKPRRGMVIADLKSAGVQETRGELGIQSCNKISDLMLA